MPLAYPQGTVDRATYGSHPRSPVVLCVGRVARMKGQDILLRAFQSLAARYPEWSVRLVGPVDDPEFQEELRATAIQLGLSERFVLTGFQDPAALASEFSRASVFCLPSVHSESAGQVKYEATALGLPVVTTDVPCGRDAREMGWLVARAGDPEELAASLERLMRDEGERARVAARSQSGLKSYLDLARTYRTVMGSSSPGG